MELEDLYLLNWCLNHWNLLMTSREYEEWYMEELSAYESQKEWYENESFN